MTQKILEAAGLLARARRHAERVRLPQPLQPVDAAEAYAIQDAIGQALHPQQPVPGWKVGAASAGSEPSAAPIYEILRSPAQLSAARMHMIGVEAEIAFVFGTALPPRATAYGEDEAIAAVRGLCVAIEVCDSRLDDWQTAGDAAKLADHQLNFALVTGAASDRVQAADFGTLGVRTRVDGQVIAQGTGCHAVGNPLGLVPWLVNHARGRGGIAAGAVVTTGSWLGMHFVQPGSTVSVEFDGVGSAQVTFAA